MFREPQAPTQHTHPYIRDSQTSSIRREGPLSSGHHHSLLHSSFQQGPYVSSVQAHLGPLYHTGFARIYCNQIKSCKPPPHSRKPSSAQLGIMYVLWGPC